MANPNPHFSGKRHTGGKVGRKIPRNALKSIDGLISEMARIYRKAKAKKMEHEEARSLVWILAQMRSLIEAKAITDLEMQLAKLSISNGAAHEYNGTLEQPLLLLEHDDNALGASGATQ